VVLTKNVRMGGKVSAQFKLELLNITNIPKFLDGPIANISSPDFGTITRQAGFPRTTQFTLRLTF